MKCQPFRPSLIARGIATRMGRNAACSGLTKRGARCGHAARAQICLTATSSPPPTRNNSDPSQTSPHFYHLLPHPSRTFVLRPAKHRRLQVGAAQHSSSAVPVAQRCSRQRKRSSCPQEGRDVRGRKRRRKRSECCHKESCRDARERSLPPCCARSRPNCRIWPKAQVSFATRTSTCKISAGRWRGRSCGPKPRRARINPRRDGLLFVRCTAVTSHRLQWAALPGCANCRHLLLTVS
jgi:hypothetical protein